MEVVKCQSCKHIIKRTNMKVCDKCFTKEINQLQTNKQQLEHRNLQQLNSAIPVLQKYVAQSRQPVLEQVRTKYQESRRSELKAQYELNAERIRLLQLKLANLRESNEGAIQMIIKHDQVLKLQEASLQAQLKERKEKQSLIEKKQSLLLIHSLLFYDCLSSHSAFSFLSDVCQESTFEYYEDEDTDMNATVFIHQHQQYEEAHITHYTEIYLKLKDNVEFRSGEGVSAEHAHNCLLGFLNCIMILYRIQQIFLLVLPFPIYIDGNGWPQLTSGNLFEIIFNGKVMFLDMSLTRIQMNINFIIYSFGGPAPSKYFDFGLLIQQCQHNLNNQKENRCLRVGFKKMDQQANRQMRPATSKEAKFQLHITKEERAMKQQALDDDFELID